MKLKLMCSSAAAVVLLAAAAFSQTPSGSSAALPPAPGTASDPAPVAMNPNAKTIAVINVEQAIFASNDGQREMGALQKKFEPKSNDLKSKSDEIEALRKQASAAGLTPDKKDDIARQLEQKQKLFDRERQDAQEDFQQQQTEIGQRIFQKMGPIIMKYAQDNNLGMIVDTSTPWPSSPILWANPASMDITNAIVTAYNAQAPTAAAPSGGIGGSTAKPPVTRPAPSTTKPATGTPAPK